MSGTSSPACCDVAIGSWLRDRAADRLSRSGSDCFISTPGMFVIPPWGKSGGSVNITSTVWQRLVVVAPQRPPRG